MSLFGVAKKARICEYMKVVFGNLDLKCANESLHKHCCFDQILVHIFTMQYVC